MAENLDETHKPGSLSKKNGKYLDRSYKYGLSSKKMAEYLDGSDKTIKFVKTQNR